MSDGIFTSASEARLGSLGILPMLACPPLPNIISEWTAIIPLICHLASQRDDYITTGEIALLGRVSIGLFPRLGTLSGLGRLLSRGTKYLDHASTKGGTSRMVWDVKWGSVFPCANGAASAAVAKHLLKGHKTPLQRMPETLFIGPQRQDSTSPLIQNRLTVRPGCEPMLDVPTHQQQDNQRTTEETVRRYQVLHVYRLSRKPRQRSLRQKTDRLRLSTACQIVWFFFLFCFVIVLGLLGSYGTAALILCTSVSELVARSIRIRRPSGYLRNNEAHDACMLVASHENATEWHLYIGDRGIADTLLNKPMFVVPEGRSARYAAAWFWFAHVLQFTAMTFVAAQKAWDGVWLVVLLFIHCVFRWSPCGRPSACDWMEWEGIESEVQSFEFGGRYAMMGAIHVFSGSDNTRWMDNILVPHPRRDAWLQTLRGKESEVKLDRHDEKWLEHMSNAALASSEVLVRLFGDRGWKMSV